MDPAFERHCSELVARERSGHTAVVLDSLLYVWGGYMSIGDEEVFIPRDEIWVYDLEGGRWQVFHMTGDVPPSMSGTCGCCLNENMYIFGGCDDSGQTNQMFCVDLTDGKYVWKKILPLLGSAPSPRDKLSCWVYDGKIIYFGGYGHKVLADISNRNRNFILDEPSWVENLFWGWNNEVHIFDPVQRCWTEPQTHGRPPAPRAAHASTALGSRGYIFGGRVVETRTNDIHCLDFESWTWTEIVPLSSSPVGRSWHTLTAVSETSFFLFGGLSNDCKPMSDGWLFDTETKKWREFEHPYKNKPRLWHTACSSKDSDVVVFGGSCDYILLVDSGHCNDALVFQIEPHPLFRICEDYIAKNVRTLERLRNQLPCLPPKVLQAVQRRIAFYRPSKKQNNSQNPV
ncbi:PREDICTED: kelch domain-containing protein 1 [Cyprinodon variegatus]|uniref:Kelch domain containing 1 n=1 Tax=Cyprinodon variegatus TaxID=28743 RepID=A0A3Q2CD29_CYPVA|nr:PREDICTED: kelch domain-containing protein 1 [Cyprinodon variegatus]XP_015244968.1 PREDICTED: kelch domain-containing protein 1 [Cyprinodon variegatus]